LTQCLLSLGANLGQPAAALDQAIAQLAATPGISAVRASRKYRTRPVGGPPGQGEFLNAAVCCTAALSPQELLSQLLSIEEQLGRVRQERWGPRQIDIDLLLYGERECETPRLTLPHPRMTFRAFVLLPADEVAPAMRHPGVGWPIRRLLNHLRTGANEVAILGGESAARRQLAKMVAAAATVYHVDVYDGGELDAAAKGRASRWLRRPPKLFVWSQTTGGKRPIERRAERTVPPEPLRARGPVLQVANDDLPAAAAEVSAAIEAMQLDSCRLVG